MSFVSEIFCDRSCCFCLHKSTDVGLNLSALSTFLSSLSIFRDSLLTCLNALSSFVVSPRNSIVIPLIFPAVDFPYPKNRSMSFWEALRLRFPCFFDCFSDSFWRSLYAITKSPTCPSCILRMSDIVSPRSSPARMMSSSVTAEDFSDFSLSSSASSSFLSLRIPSVPCHKLQGPRHPAGTRRTV